MFSKFGSGAVIAATAISMVAVTQASAMQFGGIFGRSSNSSERASECDTVGESAGRSIIGGVLGGAARSLGIPTFVPVEMFSDTLATEIACRLDPEEQEKAAEANMAATRSGEVGTTVEWESETREGVRGSSTVLARNEEADGTTCMDVNDVIIVGGEETTVTQRMCRGPGESRFTRAA